MRRGTAQDFIHDGATAGAPPVLQHFAGLASLDRGDAEEELLRQGRKLKGPFFWFNKLLTYKQ